MSRARRADDPFPVKVNGEVRDGWTSAALGDLVQPSPEKIEPQDAPRSKYLSLEHVESGSHRILGRGLGSDVGSTKAVFRRGDVLYGKLRPYLNKVCIPDFDGICSTDFLVFRPSPALDQRLLMHFLSQPGTVEYANHHSSGVQLPRVSFEKLAELEVPIPPLAEQKRIVTKVEELLAQVNAARERLARVPAILKRFRQAVLSAACDGGLTEAWRAAHPETEPAESLLVPPSTSSTPGAVDHLEGMNPPGSWVLARVDRLVKIQNGRAFPSGDYQEDGVKLLRPGNLMRDGGVQWAADNTVSLPARWAVECPDLLLGENELLMNLTAQSLKDEFLGRVCIKRDSDQALLNQRIARFKNLGDHELRPYLFLYFRSWLFRTFVNNLDTGSLIRHMHSKDVARHVLPLPPLEEQDEIVRRVEALFKLADTIEKRVAAATARAEKLTQAILAKAFRGELVPTEAELARREGRAYEAAAALLERVRSESVGADARGDSRRGRAIEAGAASTRSESRRGA